MYLSNVSILARMLCDPRFIRFLCRLLRQFSTGGRIEPRANTKSLLARTRRKSAADERPWFYPEIRSPRSPACILPRRNDRFFLM